MKKVVLFLITILVASAIVLIIFLNHKPSTKRTQEPTKPYSYYSEEVTFQSTQANVILAGTLTLPAKEGNYPAVVLISGSGPQNRDEEVLGHKPFLILSDHLTKNGIAVLRYDDRGVSQSSGDYKSATSLDFAADVEGAIAYLKTRKEVNKNKIGLVGHSEGGIIAPLVAAKSIDVAFIVLLAGPGIPLDKLLMMQPELNLRALGASEFEIQKTKRTYADLSEIITRQMEEKSFKSDLTKFLHGNSESIPTYLIPPGMTKEQFISGQIDMISSPWFRFIWNYDPKSNLGKITCPILAINGEKDLQVSPKENLAAIDKVLKEGGNKNVTIKELPGLNHFFQECKTGSPTEYGTIEQTFSPIALKEISSWILKQVN